MSQFRNGVWLFTLASMAGFLLESGESLITLGYVQNRQGLLYGPFAPVYGAGAVVFALLLPRLRRSPLLSTFLLSALAGAAVEYLWSFCQQRWFGVIFWDYSGFRFQLDGRVNLLFTLFWGLLGLAFRFWLWPALQRLGQSTNPAALTLTALLLTLFFAGNSLWSSAALVRQAQRREGVPAFSPLTAYLDAVWSDESLQRQFPTMREAEKEQTP